MCCNPIITVNVLLEIINDTILGPQDNSLSGMAEVPDRTLRPIPYPCVMGGP